MSIVGKGQKTRGFFQLTLKGLSPTRASPSGLELMLAPVFFRFPLPDMVWNSEIRRNFATPRCYDFFSAKKLVHFALKSDRLCGEKSTIGIVEWQMMTDFCGKS